MTTGSADTPGDEAAPEHDDESLLEQLREMPVGVNDPNIIGDAGPLDIPPGSDPHGDAEFTGAEADEEDAD